MDETTQELDGNLGPVIRLMLGMRVSDIYYDSETFCMTFDTGVILKVCNGRWTLYDGQVNNN